MLTDCLIADVAFEWLQRNRIAHNFDRLHMLRIEDAVWLRDCGLKPSSGAFICRVCGQPLRPHREGESGWPFAHFTHLRKNNYCRYSAGRRPTW